MCEAAARGGVERRVFGFGLPFLFFSFSTREGHMQVFGLPCLERSFLLFTYLSSFYFIGIGWDR